MRLKHLKKNLNTTLLKQHYNFSNNNHLANPLEYNYLII
ncbi:hypothetical protein ABID22_001807 [Pontibacter aydingkolensis]